MLPAFSPPFIRLFPVSPLFFIFLMHTSCIFPFNPTHSRLFSLTAAMKCGRGGVCLLPTLHHSYVHAARITGTEVFSHTHAGASMNAMRRTRVAPSLLASSQHFWSRRCASTTLRATTIPEQCILCDARWDDAQCPSSSASQQESCETEKRRWWDSHCRAPTHIAREAVCKQFVEPDHSAFIVGHMQKHLGVDLNTLDTVDAQRVRRRRTRLYSSLEHLLLKKVVYQYVPTLSLGKAEDRPKEEPAAPMVSDAFLTHMIVGESYARREVLDRASRLMPRTSATELSSITTYILSTRRISQLYDELDFTKLLLACGAPREAAQALTAREKTLVVYSCVGELHLFTRTDRPRGVTDKQAANTLVSHVLASHAVDGIIADLVHSTLQRVVDEGVPVYQQFREEAQRGI